MHTNNSLIQTKIISPYLYFAISWCIVLIAYSLYWSNLLPRLSAELWLFFLFAIAFCAILFYFSGKLEFNFQINEKKMKKKLRRGALFCIFLFSLEAAAARGFPLLSIIKGNFTYAVFGLPFIHVILYAFSSIYVSLSFLSYEITRTKKFRYYTLFFFFPGVLCFTRSFIIYNLLYCLIIHFSFKKLDIKTIFRTFLVLFILAYAFIMAFGYLGEIRSNSKDVGGGYIEMLSKPSKKFKQTGLSPLLLWGYDYVATPLGNLQNTMNSGKYVPCSSIDDAELIFYHFMPELFKKRIFPSAEEKTDLIVPYFNVSSIFTDAWAKLGWFGILYSFFGMIVIVAVVYRLKKRRNIYSYLSFVFLSVIVFFNMFTNMFNFMGLAPQFWLAFIMSFSWKKVFVVNNVRN